MNILKNRPHTVSAAAFLCCFFLALAVIFLGIKFIPDAIIYTAGAYADDVSPADDESTEGLYDSIYIIRESGPFSILSEGENIFVYCENTPIYRIDARLSEFPPSDKDAIIAGMSVYDRASLYEIVEYMES